ncbi:cryptochrome/photolyase family protein [Ilumatobacter nonamiensis]|uniref:cryptochrome/photolyase family protein n=1 Tax=Ilumatobacter nonamiensis TaxID=467093 RepID=UPI0003473D05|nr:cryptochrome/photolyase family protein [Ilumatobacter nonamiensis]
MNTVWVLGDQLNRHLGALADADPTTDRVLIIESTAKVTSKRWHVQRAHFVIASMRRFADELSAAGFEVDHRRSRSLADGFREHVDEFEPDEVIATEPASWDGLELFRDLGVTTVRSNQFLCHYQDFADWADGRNRLRMEDFYRWQRKRLGYLMDQDGEPVGGRWNFDDENREPPPGDESDPWAAPQTSRLDELDREVLADLDDVAFDNGGELWGTAPDGTWATTRRAALSRLRHFVDEVLPRFGPHEDAMVRRSWHLAHSTLSPYMNIGLLLPGEVCDAVQDAYDDGRVPLNSAEGFIRQVIGWREYVWGVYWLWMPEYRSANVLGADRALPPVFSGAASTEMNCVDHCLSTLHSKAYNHHIQRLMVLGNLAMLHGVDPWAMTTWMWSTFIDGAEWVMLPNVIGMSQWADGGRMATKPYAAGGNYIDTMSDYCGDCRFDRTQRVGDDACPFTTLYWDFLDRHHDRLVSNPRIARQVRAAEQLSDLDAVRSRAAVVRDRLDVGDL